MTISVKCPQCGHDYQLVDAAAGKRFRCRDCDTILSVPESGTAREDPYDTGIDWDEEPRPRRPRALRTRVSQSGTSVDTLLPAIGMYLGAGIYIPFLWVMAIGSIMQPIDPAGLPPPGPQREAHIAGYRMGQMLIPMIATISCVIELVGAYHLHTHRSRKLAFAGAILCCIPCLSPCVFLGIPIGIWALVVLNLEDVKTRFS